MIAQRLNSTGRHVTLALGGGGARGLAHFGAVQAVVENGFDIDRIVGVSIGSLAGAMCAIDGFSPRVSGKVLRYIAGEDFASKQETLFGAHPTANATNSGLLAWYDQIKSYLWARHLLNRVFRKRSLLAGHLLEELIAELIPDIDISATSVPLSIVAVDLKSGHPIVLEHGSLRRAIAASAAIPGIFPPVAWDGMLLCDLGVLDSLPTQVADSYQHDLIIGVDVGPSLERVADCASALHILLRMDEIGERLYRRHAHRLADILIQPDVGHCQWFDFTQPARLMEAGLIAGRQSIDAWFRRQSASDLPVSSKWRFRLNPHCAAP